MHFNLRISILSQCIALVTSCAITSSYAQTFTEIPAVNTTMKEMPYFKFYLELVINTYSTQKVVPVLVKNNDLLILRKDLEDLELDYSKFTSESDISEHELAQLGLDTGIDNWIKLNIHGENYSIKYQSQNQQLQFNLPSNWLPEQMIGKDYWYKKR